MGNELPEGYIEGITRVSNVCSHMFPFKGTYEEGEYHKWLIDDVPDKRKRGYSIEVKDYEKEACDVGTFIHEQMENKILGKVVVGTDDKHRAEIENGLNYINTLQKQYPDIKWNTEVVVRDKDDRFQGSIDLVRICEETKTVWVYDWKTWGIAKKKWGLPNKITTTLKSGKKSYKKNSGKLQKVALQLSLYAETYRQKGYSIGGIYVVHLHEEGAFELPLTAEENKRDKSGYLRLWSSNELSKLLLSYLEAEKIKKQLELKDAQIIFNPNSIMKFEIRVPQEAYAYINVSIDMYQEKEGKTIEEKLVEARGAIKYYLDLKSAKTNK